MAEMINLDSEFAPTDCDQTMIPDPALRQFLQFLKRDIEKNPQNLKAICSGLVSRAQSLVSGVDIDLNVQLLDEDE